MLSVYEVAPAAGVATIVQPFTTPVRRSSTNPVSLFELSCHVTIALVGEITVLDHQPRSATVTALDEVQLLVLGHKDLAAALTKVPVLAARLAMLMAERQASSAAPVAERLAHAGERLASL